MKVRVRQRLILGVLGVVVIVLLLFQTPLLAVARAHVWDGIVTTVGNVFQIGSLRVDNDTHEQLQTLTAENIRLKAESAAFEQLQQQLGITSYTTKQVVPALVVARPLDTYRAQIVLNKGIADGLAVGSPVVVYGSVLVGHIVEVNEHSAVCQLLFHPGTSLNAVVPGDTLGRGLLVGQHFTSVNLTTVPRDVPLQSGQVVVTGAQDQIPPGLLLGRVATIRNEENEAYQSAEIDLPYDVDQLDAVAVLVSP